MRSPRMRVQAQKSREDRVPVKTNIWGRGVRNGRKAWRATFFQTKEGVLRQKQKQKTKNKTHIPQKTEVQWVLRESLWVLVRRRSPVTLAGKSRVRVVRLGSASGRMRSRWEMRKWRSDDRDQIEIRDYSLTKLGCEEYKRENPKMEDKSAYLGLG